MKPQSAPMAMPATAIRATNRNGRSILRQDRQEDDGAGTPGAHQQLALGADVPEVHPEGQRTGEPGEDERRGHDQGVGQDADGAEGRADDVDVGADGIAADEGDDDAADDQATATAPTVVASGSQRGTSRRRSRRSSKGLGSTAPPRGGHGAQRVGSRRIVREPGGRQRPAARPAGHQQADGVDVRLVDVEGAQDEPLVDDGDAIGERRAARRVSSEMSRQAAPASRRAWRSRWTASMAPTSSPRVGWTATISFGLDSISRARMRRWRLPPERRRTCGVDRRCGDVVARP